MSLKMTPEQIARDLATLKKLKAERERLRLRQLAALERVEQYRIDNKIEFFVPYRGVVDPNKKLEFPQQNPKQELIINEWENPERRIFVLSGGNRSAKTSTCVVLTLCVLFGCYPWTGSPGKWHSKKRINLGHKKPRRVRIIGQDWKVHIGEVIIPALKYWWPADKPVYTKKNNEGIEYFWTDKNSGSTLEVLSNRQEVDVFEGWEGDLIYADEPFRREIYIASKRGLIDRTYPGCLSGRVLMGMTLLKEPWIDREIIKRRLDDGRIDPSVFNVHLKIHDNVGFGITRQGVEEYIKDLRPEEISARIDGVPMYMTGLVAKDFNRNIHVKPRFDIPSDWIVDIGIDVHPRVEQAILFIATNPHGIRYGCFEIFEHGDGPATADKIVRLVRRYALRVGRVIIDPLAKGDKNNDDTVFDKIKEVLARHGMFLETASKDKVSGVLEINRHLKGPNNEPSLFFFDDMKRTIWEIEGWIYDEDTQVPQKVDDHFCENLYRLLLLDTQWTPPAAWVSEDVPEDVNACPVTGY